MKIGVLNVQGAVSEHLVHLEQCEVTAVAVKTPADLEMVSGLIIPGGESTTIGRLLVLFGLSEAIKARSAENSLAIFGTCAGMILIAREITDGIKDQPRLGLMDIAVKRNAFGRQKESFETKLKFASLEPPLTAVFIRAPVIVRAHSSVETLAEMPEGIVAARQGLILTTSFHPELTSDLRVHRYFIKMCEAL